MSRFDLLSGSEDDFDWSQDPKTLRAAFKRTNFDSIFDQLISRDVIATLSPQLVAEPHNLIYDDDQVYKYLIGPLERFICNLDEDASQEEVDSILEHVKTLKQPSKMCRKVLKTGDVLFSCNDCGLDATCVVCIDCFHKSAHKDHNYRMSNTDGGGCCDCGDLEAWKQHHACSDHMAPDQPNLSLADFESKELRSRQIESDKLGIVDKISLLPQGLAFKYFLVCQASLHYARTMLTWSGKTTLPENLDSRCNHSSVDNKEIAHLLQREPPSKNYFTVVFNDEVHTYDYVINTFVKIIKCTKMTASIMASSVSREGRSFILNGTYKECMKVRDDIVHVRDSGQGPLRVEVIHGSILAHQAFAMKLIEWMQRMSLLCDAFRVLTAYTLLGSYDPIQGQEDTTCDMTLLERIMLSNTIYWKNVRVVWNELFVTTLLTEYSVKEKFARLITRNYPKLMHDFIKDDHDHSVSILSMTTQLYTVPSLLCMLIEEENALEIISQTLIEICKNTKRESSTINFENRHTFDLHSLKRGFYIISDLRHLINVQPTRWSEELCNNVIGAVGIFLNLLSSMQGMDSVKRQLGQHLEYEPEWETGMTLQSRLIVFISKLVTYCGHNERVLVETLRESQRRLLRNGGYKTVTKELYGHKVTCIQYDVSTAPVSVHLPLTRFAAALILELMQRRKSNKPGPYDENLVILTDQSENSGVKSSMIDIMEPSLRTEVMIAQFRSGMWRRNGYSLINQILYFSGALMRKEMYDRDILVLQECAATCEANEFMIHLLNKFNLFTWVSSETTREPLVGPKAVSFYNDEEIMTQTMALGEEFLQLLLTIIGERYRVGIGKIEEEDEIKNEIIQLLCIGPFTRSDLTTKLYVNDKELDCIKAVANLKRSSESSTGKYELKEEFYCRFNPFFYHYNRRHQSHALDAQLKRKRQLKENLICCPPPKPVELTDQFKNLNELLKCDLTFIIIQKVLRRALGPPEGSQECSTKATIRFLASDLQLDQCLHLIGLGLHEQEREPLEFRYIEAAHEFGIFPLMAECYLKAQRSKDLIHWLMEKVKNLLTSIEQMKSARTTHGTSTFSYSSASVEGASAPEATVENVDQKAARDLEAYAKTRDSFKNILTLCDTVKQESKKRNSELAAQRRERIMAMMRVNQEKFLSNAKQLVAETESKSGSSHSLTQQLPPHPASSSSSASTPLTSQTNSDRTASSSSTRPNQQSAYVTRSGRRVKQPKSLVVGGSGSGAQTAGQRTTEQIDSSQGTPSAEIKTGETSMDYESETNDSDEFMDCQSITMDDNATNEEEQRQQQQPHVEASHLCILCRDEQRVGFDEPTMVLLAYIQRSAVLSKNRSGERRIPNYALTPSNHLRHQYHYRPYNAPEVYSFTSDNSWSFDATFMPADCFFGPYISTCGHAMHLECWQGFSDSVTKRETSRPNRAARHVSFELEKNELLCPLCECISNATIPLLPDYTRFSQQASGPRQLAHQSRTSPPLGVSIESDPEKIASRTTITTCPMTTPPQANYMDEMSAGSLSASLHALRSAVSMFVHIRHTKEVGGASGSKGGGMSGSGRSPFNRSEDKYMRLLRPKLLNDVLEELGESEALILRDFITTTRGSKILSSDCSKSLLKSISTLAERIHSVGLDLDKSITNVRHDRIFMMTSWTIAYTIKAHEHASRFKGSPLFEDLESSRNLCLSSLLRFACGSMITFQSDIMQSLLVQKLRYLLINEEHLSSSPSCLDIDAFEMYVSITILLQTLYSHQPDKNAWFRIIMREETAESYAWTTCVYDHQLYRNVLHLMLILNLIQVLVTIQNDTSEPDTHNCGSSVPTTSKEADNSERMQQQQHKTDEKEQQQQQQDSSTNCSTGRECLVLHGFYKDVVIAAGHPNNKLLPANEQFVNKIRSHLLPFLRSCAIFYYHLSHVNPPTSLQTKSPFFEGRDFSTCNSSSASHNQHKQQQQWRKQTMTATNTITTTSSSMGGTPNLPTVAIKRQTSCASVDELGFRVQCSRQLQEQLLQQEFDLVHFDETNEEFRSICDYLKLPSDFTNLLESHEARNLALAWLRDPRVLLLIKAALKERADIRRTLNSSAGAITEMGKETITTKASSATTAGHLAADREGGSNVKSFRQRQALKRAGSSSTSPSSTGCSPLNSASAPIAAGGALVSTSSTSASSYTMASSSRSPASGGSRSGQPCLTQVLPGSELMPIKFVRQPHTVNRLIDLPYDYSELVDKVSDFTCPSIQNEDSRTPTMCLVCGVMLCSQSYCCQRDLNDLASNYKQVLQLQEEARKQLMAGASAGGSSASTSAAAATIAAATGGREWVVEFAEMDEESLALTTAALTRAMHNSPPTAANNATDGSAAAALMFSGAAGNGGQQGQNAQLAQEQRAAAARVAMARAVNASQGLGGGSSSAQFSVANVLAGHIHQQLVGSCTYHAHECSAGVGIFLRIRNSQILLLSGRSKGCYMPAPYIDDHGETDFGLIRGNPLHLNRQHYERLQSMWMNHAIPEQISRTLEYSSYASNINWLSH